MNRSLFAIALLFVLPGCLKTRSDMRENEQRQVLANTVTTLQKDTADSSARFYEVNEALREVRGRIDSVEYKLSNQNQQSGRDAKVIADQSAETSRRVALLQESITRMEEQIQSMGAEILAQKAEIAALRAGGATATAGRGKSESSLGTRRDSYQTALEHFDKKDWKKAILGLQEYREKNPKGKKIPDATYRMGVCFQELGMKDEAKTFYDEVVAKFPSSNEAKKAKIRLKSLKK